MVQPRYQPPVHVPDTASAAFRPWLLAQLRALADDQARIAATDAPTVIAQERLDVPAGAVRRVSPSTGGMVVVLEAPSPANAGATITLIVEAPTGALVVAASPHTGADGKVTESRINGARRATFTLPGEVTFRSNGQGAWVTQAQVPAETPSSEGPVGPTGAAGAVATVADRTVAGNESGATGPAESTPIGDALDWAGDVGAFAFDNSTDAVRLGTSADFSFERTDPFTLSIWFRTAETSGTLSGGGLISKSNNSNVGYRFGFNNSTSLTFDLINTSGSNQALLDVTCPAINDNVLHHAVATSDGTGSTAGMHIYVDGVEGSRSVAGTLSASIVNAVTVALGLYRNDSTSSFDGFLSNATIWDKAFSGAEVLELYGDGNISDPREHSAAADLLGWWVMGPDDIGGVVTDRVGSADGVAVNDASTTFGSVLVRNAGGWEAPVTRASGLPFVSNGQTKAGTFQQLAEDGIADASVSNAKQANMAQATIKLRASGAGTGAPINGTVTQALDMAGSTRGSLPLRGASAWGILTPGTVDLPLVSNGSGADPAYEQLVAAGLADSSISPAKLAVLASSVGAIFALYVSFAAGAGGSADDVTIFNADAPFGFRQLKTLPYVSTAVGGATLQARSASGGLGSALSSTFSAASATEAPAITSAITATTTVAAGGSLFIRRSDSGVAGEWLVLCVRN